jgi:hypothetical protein
MDIKNSTASYLDLGTKTYGIFMEAFAAANQRALDYAKSVYEISSRPYASTALETTMRENFDRANQLVSLTISELQTSAAKTSELSEKLIAHGAKFQDTAIAAMRGVVDTGISNMNFVKSTAAQQIDEFAKRMDEAQNHAAASVSSN